MQTFDLDLMIARRRTHEDRSRPPSRNPSATCIRFRVPGASEVEVPQPRSCKHARDTVEQPWEPYVLSLVYDAQPDRVKLAPGCPTTRLMLPSVENVSYS
jgi:hypothetical protein